MRPHCLEEPGLTVDKGMDPAGQPVECLHRLIKQLGRAGFGIATMQPVQVESGFGREGLLFASIVDFDESHRPGAGFETFERSPDRRDRGFVADKKVPVGGRVGGIRAAGAPQVHGVASFRLHCPWARIALPAKRISPVHHEVDREFFGPTIDRADRVCPEYGPGFLWHDVTDLGEVQRFGIGRVGVEEHKLHVAIGGRASRLLRKVVIPGKERRKALATEHDAAHVWRQSFGTDNGEFYWMGLAHAV